MQVRWQFDTGTTRAATVTTLLAIIMLSELFALACYSVACCSVACCSVARTLRSALHD